MIYNFKRFFNSSIKKVEEDSKKFYLVNLYKYLDENIDGIYSKIEVNLLDLNKKEVKLEKKNLNSVIFEIILYKNQKIDDTIYLITKKFYRLMLLLYYSSRKIDSNRLVCVSIIGGSLIIRNIIQEFLYDNGYMILEREEDEEEEEEEFDID